MITLKTLPLATAQEVFDQCTRHLLTQNEKSEDGEPAACRYHHRHLRCAAGCFIADDEYSPALEGKAWEPLAVQKVVPGAHARLITDLQVVHDRSPPWKWFERLTNLAKDRGLTPPSPQTT